MATQKNLFYFALDNTRARVVVMAGVWLKGASVIESGPSLIQVRCAITQQELQIQGIVQSLTWVSQMTSVDRMYNSLELRRRPNSQIAKRGWRNGTLRITVTFSKFCNWVLNGKGARALRTQKLYVRYVLWKSCQFNKTIVKRIYFGK